MVEGGRAWPPSVSWPVRTCSSLLGSVEMMCSWHPPVGWPQRHLLRGWDGGAGGVGREASRPGFEQLLAAWSSASMSHLWVWRPAVKKEGSVQLML